MITQQELYIANMDRMLKENINRSIEMIKQDDSFDDLLLVELHIGNMCLQLKKPVPVEGIDGKLVLKIVDYFEKMLQERLDTLLIKK